MSQRRDPAVDEKSGAEFLEFLNAPELPAPRAVTERIVSAVQADLHPSIWSVMPKLAAIHCGAGGVSLLICAQFGMGRSTALTHAFMRLGELMCLALCGALFVGLTGFVAGLALSSPELALIRKAAYSPLLVLQILSLLVFIVLGAEIAFGLGSVWLLGGLLSGSLLAEAASTMKRVVVQAT